MSVGDTAAIWATVAWAVSGSGSTPVPGSGGRGPPGDAFPPGIPGVGGGRGVGGVGRVGGVGGGDTFTDTVFVFVLLTVGEGAVSSNLQLTASTPAATMTSARTEAMARSLPQTDHRAKTVDRLGWRLRLWV